MASIASHFNLKNVFDVWDDRAYRRKVLAGILTVDECCSIHIPLDHRSAVSEGQIKALLQEEVIKWALVTALIPESIRTLSNTIAHAMPDMTCFVLILVLLIGLFIGKIKAADMGACDPKLLVFHLRLELGIERS